MLFERPFSTDLQMKTGAFVILGHAFTYIINDLVTGLRAEGGLEICCRIRRNRVETIVTVCGQKSDQQKILYDAVMGNHVKGREQPCQKHII